jgi:cobaltochelatase CobN
MLQLLLCLQTLASSPQPQPERVLVLGGWDYGEAVFARAAHDVGMSASFVTTEEVGKVTGEQLENSDVVLLLNLPAQGALSLRDKLAEVKKRRADIKVLALDQRDSQKGIQQAGLMTADPAIYKYWRFNGAENTRRLLEYIRVRHLGKKGEIRPPVPIADSGVFHPLAPDVFPDVPAYLNWLTTNRHWIEGGPRIALLVQQSFLVTGDTKVFAAIIDSFHRRGVNVACLFANDPKKQRALLDAWKPELIIDDAHASPSLAAGAAEMDVPILKDICLLRSTIAEWRESSAGMLPADVSLHMLTQEVQGIIEPILVGAQQSNVGGFMLHEPIPDRVERLTDRAMKWLALRRKKNSEKRIAIVYYHKYLSSADLGRGSASGAFLDGPESLYRVLLALKARGYTLSRMPADSGELLAWMKSSGRNVPEWLPGELNQLVAHGDPVLLPVARYSDWFASISEANRQSVNQAFGPAPGKQMVWSGGKEPAIVLPRIDLGNVILLPQPARGPENDEKLLHARDVPPPHQYLAMYWWLQKEFQADAVVHFGTHGTEIMLPTKANGLSKDDFGDICLGALPNITPWILDNIAEAILAKRRAYAVLTDHLTPPLEAAGLSDELRNLHEDVHKFATLDEGLLKSKYRKSISDAARKAGLTKAAGELSDAEIDRTGARLHEIESSITAIKLHILGQEPDEKHLVPFLVNMLGTKFLDELAASIPEAASVRADPADRRADARERAEQIVRHMLRDGLNLREALASAGAKGGPEEALERLLEYRKRLAKTGDEIEYLLRALEGRFIPPGPGSDPVRNPASIPTGRNLYALNPEEVPTKQAWEVAVALTDALLKQKPVHKVALDLNAFETMRDYGVMEAQALYLMGVRPVWDSSNLAVDVQIIPREELKRPRVDVFIAISGSMRDNFASRVKLLDKAVRLVSELEESDNFVRDATKVREKTLLERGFAEQRARQLAPARIFGTKPGEYATRILYLVPKSGAWDSNKEIADVYKETMSYAFTGDIWGEQVPGLYEDAIKGSETVLRTWASNMMGPLTNHHVFEYAGGLSLAIESVTGKQPRLLLNDVRNEPRLRDFDEVMATEAHVTLLNPKWQQGMRENGYSGAGMMAETVRNTFGWQATRPGSVSQALWDEVHAVYVRDRGKTGLTEWLNSVNPHARQEIMAVLLEAHRKEYWQADAEMIQSLAKEYAESVVQFGQSGGLTGGGNERLQKLVSDNLNAPGEQALAAAFRSTLERGSKAADPSPARAEGVESAQKQSPPSADDTLDARRISPEATAPFSSSSIGPVAFLAAVLFLILVGMWRRTGVIR